MTRTGTTNRLGRSYSYYSCAVCQQKGKTVCKGCHIPAATLDEIVVTNLKQRVTVELDLVYPAVAPRHLLDGGSERRFDEVGDRMPSQIGRDIADPQLPRRIGSIAVASSTGARRMLVNRVVLPMFSEYLLG